MTPITNWYKDTWECFCYLLKTHDNRGHRHVMFDINREGHMAAKLGYRGSLWSTLSPFAHPGASSVDPSGTDGHDNCIWPSLVCADHTWQKLQKEGRSNPRMPWEAWVMPIHRRHGPNSSSYSDTHKNHTNNLSFYPVACRAYAVLQKK